ncbi:phage baseplate assembly protein, partial [Klebsiella quasipneumoniae]
MDQSNIVTLSAGGYDYAGWKSVRISAGLERQARDFELGITWSWPGGGD